MSKLIESLRGDLAELHATSAINKAIMRELDEICPPPAHHFRTKDIKQLR